MVRAANANNTCTIGVLGICGRGRPTALPPTTLVSNSKFLRPEKLSEAAKSSGVCLSTEIISEKAPPVLSTCRLVSRLSLAFSRFSVAIFTERAVLCVDV